MEEFLRRVIRGSCFTALGGVGLLSAGVGWPVASIAMVLLILSFSIHVFERQSGALAVLALFWGMLTMAGIAPNAKSVTKLTDTQFTTLWATHGFEATTADVMTSTAGASGTIDPVSRLEQLKSACDRGLLTPTECNATRAKLISALSER